jgi:hypothetical protein
MATLKKIKLPDGKEITLADWGAYPLRSTVELVNVNGIGVAPAEIRVFTYTVGQQVPLTNRNADDLDCNNALPSQMPVDEEMLVYSMQIEADPRCNPQTLQNIVLRTLFMLVVGGIKNYTDGPITRYPSGGGIAGFSIIANASVVQNGMAGVHAAKQLAIPVHIAGGEKFWGIYRFYQRQELTAPAVSAPTPIRLMDDAGNMIPNFTAGGWEPRQLVVYLDGLKKRPLS